MDEHYQAVHGVTLSDLDLKNNNHSRRKTFSPSKSEVKTKSGLGLKSIQHVDDLNNNDIHVKEEDADPDSKSLDPQSEDEKTETTEISPSPHANEEENGLADDQESLQYTPSKGAHRCPQCSKCYMTRFLLDRHVAFHARQNLIQSAMRSGAKVNGAHKDLLMQPPPVLPQDGDLYQQLRELNNSNSSQQVEEEDQNDENSGEEISPSMVQVRGEDLDGDGADGNHNQIGLDQLDTKAILAQEGIQEDVTVVMPSDPDDMCDMDAEMAECDIDGGEIRSAPKRQLLPQKPEPPVVPSKSRRKSSLPTKHKSALREVERSPLPPPSLSTSQPHSEELQQDSATTSAPKEQQEASSTSHSSSNSPKRLSETPPERSSESPSENDEINQEFQREVLRAQQTSFLQTLHTAFGNASPALFSGLYPGNGFLPPSSLPMSAAGYLRQFPPLSGRSPFGLHASVSASNPSPAPAVRSSSPRSYHSGNEDDRAEDLSLSSGSLSSPAASISQPSASSLPGGADSLVGYPRVLWDTPAGLRDGERSPSPTSLSTSANGKRLKTVWHTLSSEDLSNAATTDGRKVTSLSRTHSR